MYLKPPLADLVKPAKSENLVRRWLSKTPPLVADWHLTGMVQAERRMLMVMEREELLLGNGKKAEGCNY